MITENGTIKVETRFNEQVQKEFTAKLFIVSLVCLILGSVGIAGYLAWDIAAIILETYEPGIYILIIVAFAFAFGLIFLIGCNKSIKVARTEDKRTEYEFFGNYVVANNYSNGEQIATVKIYYKDIVKQKETKNVLFFYVQGNVAWHIGKADIAEGEQNAVLSLLGFSAQGVTMKLPDGEQEKVE